MLANPKHFGLDLTFWLWAQVLATVSLATSLCISLAGHVTRLCICWWTSPSVFLMSFSRGLASVFQGMSEFHGVLWQLFKQPCLFSKGRCLHWSESSLFSSGRYSLLWAWSQAKAATVIQVWKPDEWHTTPQPDAGVYVYQTMVASYMRAEITGARCERGPVLWWL